MNRKMATQELFFFSVWDVHVICDVSSMRDARRPFSKPSLQETSASTRNEGRTYDNEVEPGVCSTNGFIGDSLR